MDRESIQALEDRGFKVMGFVPGGGLVVSSSSDAALGESGIRWAGAILGSDKFEPGFEESGNGHYVIEFYPDVDMADARALVAAAELKLKDNPDLLRHQLLVEASFDRVRAFAEYDIVAFIYAAIPELVAGTPVQACGGPAIELAQVAPIASSFVGEGWDGPGKGPAEIKYFLGTLTSRIPAAQIKQEFVTALTEWAKYARLDFTETNRAGLEKSIDLLFATGSHGDPYPFDGRGSVLAHTFYPSPPNAEPSAGDLHFDDDEPWSVGGSLDFFSTALHELGHALGIGHINTSGAVMYPFYRKVTQLGQPDIDAVRGLYATGTGTVNSAGTGTPVPPVDAPPVTPPAAVSLRLVAPAALQVQQTASSLVVRGTASHASGIASVTWTNSRGASGSATGTTDWTFSMTDLATGDNDITITARARDNAAAPVSINLRASVSTPPPQPDTASPVLTITSPRSSSSLSYAAEIRVAGTANDNLGVASITWELGSRGGTATGTNAWSAAIPINPGMNNIVIRAYDAAGNSSWRSLSVTRR